jgi:hypothetical protein
MTHNYVKQFPVLPPSAFNDEAIHFIIPRVLELTYTSHYLQPWAQDLGFDGPPFPFDPERRALLRAELDAYYAHLYGLTRDELRYILDPAPPSARKDDASPSRPFQPTGGLMEPINASLQRGRQG